MSRSISDNLIRTDMCMDGPAENFFLYINACPFGEAVPSREWL